MSLTHDLGVVEHGGIRRKVIFGSGVLLLYLVVVLWSVVIRAT